MDTKSHDKNFTYQEIVRQQRGWEKALSHLDTETASLHKILRKYRDHMWVFAGCGTSYYLAQTASVLFELITGRRCKAVPASEILMYPQLVFAQGEKYLLIPLSRSGTTTEIVEAARWAREKLKIPTLAVSCNYQSPLSTESNYRLSFPFEAERSVVMTGSFTTMLLSILYLASLSLRERHIVEQLKEVPHDSLSVMKNNESLIREMVANGNTQDFVFLGQGPMLGIANEAALKMQEMTISVSHAYHSLEYRHGPMSTASENTLISILCGAPARVFEIALAKDLKKLGAKIFVLHSETNGAFSPEVDYEVRVPSATAEVLKPLLFMPLLQLLAYYRALAKNINPDKPKNLSQVVKLNI